jgi:hypothetical protein
MDEFTNEGVSAAAMGLLAQRIAALRNSAELKFQQAIEKRPQLPQGTQLMMWEEMKMDHQLLCNWHESAWKEQQRQQQQMGQEPTPDL